MKNKLVNFIALGFILTSCGQQNLVNAPTNLPNELASLEGETFAVNVKTGDVKKVSDLSSQGFSLDTCFFTWNNVHRSSDFPTEVKGDWTGFCPATNDPHYVMPYVSSLYKQNVSTGNYLPRVLIKQTNSNKYVGGARVNWIRTEIFATAVCTTGKYKSELKLRVFNPDGVSVPLIVMPIMSGPSDVYC